MKAYPKILQNILLPVAEKLLGTPYMSVIREWQQLEKQDPHTIQTIQQKKLQEILTHAQRNVPGYQSLPSNAKLHDFPIATKAMYRENEDQWIASGFKKEDLLIEKSSGSSGIQGKVFMSKKESFQALAHQTYLWTWAGYEPGERLLQLGMTLKRGRLKALKDRLFRTGYAQAFNLNETETAETLAPFRKQQKDAFFGGYASGLYEYARMARAQNIKDIHFKAVISWGDKMFDHYRSLIETQFHTKVFDTYGCTEGLMIAGQCEQGNYHILSPHIYLELLDEQDRPVADGEMGQVVVTRLDAYAMPLIRYRLGDLAIREPEHHTCNCGRPFPMLRRIVGRDTDVVQTPSGKKLIVHFFTGIMEHRSEIIQFRVVQKIRERFVIEYILEPENLNMEKILSDIQIEMEQKAGEKLNIDFRKVAQILPTPSGKPQIISSSLK